MMSALIMTTHTPWCATQAHAAYTSIYALETAAGAKSILGLDPSFDGIEGKEEEINRDPRYCTCLMSAGSEQPRTKSAL